MKAALAAANARADALAARALGETARADALAARTDAVARRLAALSVSGVGGGGGAPAPLPRSRHAVLALLAQRREQGPSPSKVAAGNSYLEPARGMAVYDGALAPLTPALATAALPPPLLASLAALACPALFDEASVYPLLSAALPAWVVAEQQPAHVTKGARTASALHGIDAATARGMPFFGGVLLPWGCRPELLAPAPAWRPAYVAEAKSVDTHIFEELAVYAMLGMLASLFSRAPEGCATFFPTPPRAFGLAAFPHVGYLVAVEWVARASLHVVSEPFFLGSAAHARAVAALPGHDYEREAVHVDLRSGYTVEPEPPAADAATPAQRSTAG